MSKCIYAIFDRQTNSACFIKDASCVMEFERWFSTAFLRIDSMFALYPEDYDIYFLCSFDDENMKVDVEDPPHLVCSVSVLFDIFKIPRPSARPDLARSSDEA